MKIHEILTLEKANTNSIFLLKEGLFYRAYELSAYFFVLHVQKYSVTKKFIKSVNQHIVYIGFPATYLQTILQKVAGYPVINTENCIELQGFQPTENFVEWKNNTTVIEKIETTVANHAIIESENQYKNIIEKIRQFPIATKSPVEVQQFLIEIQEQLKVCKVENL